MPVSQETELGSISQTQRTSSTQQEGETGAAGVGVGGDKNTTASISSEPYQHFWTAYDALADTERGTALFLEGTEVAQRVQKETVALAKEIIQKKEVLQTGPFRSLVISEAKSLNYFCHPLTLSQLAHFLVDTLIV